MKDLGLYEDSVTPLFKTNNNSNNNLNSNPCSPDFPPSYDPTFDHQQDFTTLSDIYTNQNLSYTTTNSTNTLDNLVHDFNLHNNNNNRYNNNNEYDFIEEPIRAADCFNSNNLQLAQAILDQLNQRLRSPASNKPLHRVAFHFKDTLRSILLSGSNLMNIMKPRISSMEEIAQTITTFKGFSGISLILMFSIFITNQALLEALHGCSFMHMVDSETDLGIQYASLMKDITEKAVSRPLLLITAIVLEECAAKSRLIRENPDQFALELRICAQVEFVPLRTFEMTLFKAVRFVDRERTVVLLSPAIFRRLGGTGTATFLADVRRISPGVVVLVDGEGWTEAATEGSFRHGMVSSMEFYSMMPESLDASVAVVGEGGGGDWMRRIEMLLLRPKIFVAVEGTERRGP